AGSIAAEIDLPRRAPLSLPSVRSCLVLNGSRHERSATQMLQAAGCGWHVLSRQYIAGADPALVAMENARLAVAQGSAQQPDAVFLIGGDTAFAFVDALGRPPLWAIGEAVPGVPVTRIAAEDLAAIPGRTRDLYLISKAGGFGSPDTLARVRACLSNNVDD